MPWALQIKAAPPARARQSKMKIILANQSRGAFLEGLLYQFAPVAIQFQNLWLGPGLFMAAFTS